MRSDSKQKLLGYAIAVGSVALACLAWLVLTLLIGNRFSSAFVLVAIIATGRFAGFRPSLLALVLGGIFVAYAQYLRQAPALPEIIAIYFVLGTVIVLLTHSERVARIDANTSAKRLRQQLDERTVLDQQLRDDQQQLEMALAAGRLGTSIWDVQSGRIKSSLADRALQLWPQSTSATTFDQAFQRIHPAASRTPSESKLQKTPLKAEAHRARFPIESFGLMAARIGSKAWDNSFAMPPEISLGFELSVRISRNGSKLKSPCAMPKNDFVSSQCRLLSESHRATSTAGPSS